jgi:outer membrane protein OmpA-like peptidoglycan-associated protein
LRIAAALWRPYLNDSRSSLSISGYADKAGSDRYNQTLSENRATNALTALRDILGSDLAAGKVSAVGLGESQATAGGVRAGAKDRRVEVKLNGLTVLSMFSQ